MVAPREVDFAPLLFAGIGFLLVAGGLLVGFLVTYHQRLLRQQQQQHAREAAYQQHLLEAIVETQELERARIGRDLHDGLGATLATAKLLTARLATLPGATDEAAVPLTLLGELLGAAVPEVRGLSHALYPAVLTRFGLSQALQQLVDTHRETATLPLTLELAYAQPLPPPQELALYRICQELLHNAVKHAHGATQLTVRLRQAAGQLTLLVEDDGCGYVPAAPGTTGGPGTGVGLRSLQARVQLLGGRLHQHAAPGQGCCTIIELAMPTP